MFATAALDAGGKRVPDGAVLVPSPLLNLDEPEWMLLHFQTSPETGWGSPQVLPVGYQKLLAKSRVAFTGVTRQRIQLLAELAGDDTTQALVQNIERQELQFAANNDAPANLVQLPLDLRNQDQQQAQQPQKKDMAGQQGPSQQALTQQEYVWRQQQRFTVNNAFLKNAYQDENASNWITNTNNLKTWPPPGGLRPGPSGEVLISLSPMTPLWLETAAQDRLVVARLVRIESPAEAQLALLAAWPAARTPSLAALGTHEHLRRRAGQPRLVCQGIVLDWPALQNLLAAEVRDLFPKAKVLPMHAEVPPHPERTMTALPVELDPGEAPAVPPAPPEEAVAPDPGPEVAADLGWTPLRVGLALAWAAALVALTAVGLGGWSLLELSERRIRFVSAVTHELRTPLTTLRLYLDMLTGGLVQSEEQRDQYLHTLHGETERLTRLVGNVLDFSRLENQRPRLELAPVRLGDLLGQVAATWRTRCADADKVLELDNELGDDYPLVTDVNLMQQIVGNLIDNACKYSRGADDPHLWVRVQPGGAGRVRIAVEDRGPGVKAAERRSIFRPFCRGRSSDVSPGGVGLGLALAGATGRGCSAAG